MDCPFCGTPNSSGKFCTNCGTPLPLEEERQAPANGSWESTAAAGEPPAAGQALQAQPEPTPAESNPAQNQPFSVPNEPSEEAYKAQPAAPQGPSEDNSGFGPQQPASPVEPGAYPQTYSRGSQPPNPPISPAGAGAFGTPPRRPVPPKPKKSLGLIITCILLGVACVLSFAFAVAGNLNAFQVRQKLYDVQSKCSSLTSENEALSQELDAMESQSSTSGGKDTYKIAQAGDTLFLYPSFWQTKENSNNVIYWIDGIRTMNTAINDLNGVDGQPLNLLASYVIQGMEQNGALVTSQENIKIGDLDCIQANSTITNADTGDTIDARSYLFIQGDYFVMLSFGQIGKIDSEFETQIDMILGSITQVD